MDNAKTYYVLSHVSNRDPRWYLQPDNNGTTDIASAQQYGSLTGAVLAAGERKFLFAFDGADRSETGRRRKWGIVKVTETPGKTERTIVSLTIIDATKPCVVADAGNYVIDRTNTVSDINQATLFDDLNDALAFVESHYCAIGRGKHLHVYNVETRPSEPTITTEVMN